MKNLKVLFFTIISFLFFSTNAYARVYTNEDVEDYLEVVLDYMNYVYYENITYSVNNGNITFTKTTKEGDVYTTDYLYNNGTYTYNTKLASIDTNKDRLQNQYDFIAAFTMLNAIVSIYDDETAKEVKDVIVSSELDNDHLSFEQHGATWIDAPIPAIPFITDSGEEFTLDGHIQKIIIDINNPKFMKLATTIDEPGLNPLEQIISIEVIDDEEPTPPDKPNEEGDGTGDNSGTTGSGTSSGNDGESSSTNKPNSGNSSSDTDKNNTSPSTTKPDSNKDKDSTSQTTINNNSSYESENDLTNKTPNLVENPKTGVYTSISTIIIAILGIVGLVYLNRNKILKKF